MGQTCDEWAEQEFAAFYAYVCEVVDSTCRCESEIEMQAIEQSMPYTVEGTQLILDDGSTPADFCIKGDRIELVDESSYLFLGAEYFSILSASLFFYKLLHSNSELLLPAA
jgi:hypothetical protein